MSYSLLTKTSTGSGWSRRFSPMTTGPFCASLEALMSGKGAVLALLVEIRGGAWRSLGAQMVVREDGRYCVVLSLAAAWRPLPLLSGWR